MKVKVLLPFNDKYNLARTFTPGEVVDFEEKRAQDIVSRGLGAFEETLKATKEPYIAPVAEKPVEKVEETDTVESVENAEPIAENTESESAEKAENAEPEKVEKKKPGRKPKNAE